MDILKLIDDKARAQYTNSYSYKTSFMGQKLFAPRKTRNLEVEMKKVVANGDLPVMAQVHSFDAEARIGDRPNFEAIKLEKFFIKEKINLTERVAEYFGNRATEDEVTDFIYDDYGNMLHRVLTRTEVMNMELLATGKVTVKENELLTTVDYGVPAGNKTAISGWDVANHDIIGDINTQIAKAKKNGKKIVRAITSSTIIGYMMANTAIKGYFTNSMVLMTEASTLAWLSANFGIEFVVNDDYYKTSAQATQGYRFFPEQVITFLTTTGTVGDGLFGVTPEELMLTNKDVDISEKSFVTLTAWAKEDPCAVWTKASGLYVPVLKDNASLYICTHTPSN